MRISADGKTISIAIDIQEGELHKISQIEFKGDIIFDEQEIRKKLKSKPGNTFRSFPVPGRRGDAHRPLSGQRICLC